MSERMFEVKRDREQGTITISIKRPEMTSEAGGHLRTATKETLLSLRALLDGAISRIERGERKGERKDINIE